MIPAPRELPSLAVGLVACALLAGCQDLRVEPFRGSWISLTMTWPLQQPMPMGPPQPVLLPGGEHLELWAQLGDGSTVRLVADEGDPAAFPGFDVRPALSPNDPCLIRALDRNDTCFEVTSAACGAHLLSADAQPAADAGDRELQRQALVQHVRQVVSLGTPIAVAGVSGKAPVPLLALTEYDPGGREGAPVLPLTEENAGQGPDAQVRAERCVAFARAHPNYYLGNPRQLTNRLRGALYGFFNFSTTPSAQTPDLPSQNFGGMVVTTLSSLRDLKALLLTRETERAPAAPSADPARRVVTGAPLPAAAGGRGVIRLALVATLPLGPMGAPVPVTVGTASVLTGLDQGIEE